MAQLRQFLGTYRPQELVNLLQKKYGEAPKVTQKVKSEAGHYELELPDLIDFYNQYDTSKTHRAQEFLSLYQDPADLLKLLQQKYGDSPPITRVYDKKDENGELEHHRDKLRLKDYLDFLTTGFEPHVIGQGEDSDGQEAADSKDYVRAQHVKHLEKETLVKVPHLPRVCLYVLRYSRTLLLLVLHDP